MKDTMAQNATVTVTDYGTYLYMAPEQILHGAKNNYKTGVWAEACTLIELFTQKDIWLRKGKGKRMTLKAMLAMNFKMSKLPDAFEKLQDEVKKALLPALKYVPDERCSVAILLAAINELC